VSDGPFSPASLPLPLRIAAIALVAFLLTGFFVYLGFPYDLLATRLAGMVEQQSGVRLSYGAVTASPQLQGPGIAVSDLRVVSPRGDAYEVSRLVLRPAWSLSWLAGEPAIHLDGDAAFGRVRGVADLFGDAGFDGEVTGLDLGTVLRAAGVSAGLTGSADLEGGIHMGPQGPEGPVHLVSRDGVISHPDLPMDVPYQELEAELVFGGDNWLEIVSCDITSPMGTGKLGGRIAKARSLQQAPLDLALEITAAENMRQALRAQRVRIDANGRIEMKVSGNLARPVVR
jgi:type II secretion system protein N